MIIVKQWWLFDSLVFWQTRFSQIIRISFSFFLIWEFKPYDIIWYKAIFSVWSYNDHWFKILLLNDIKQIYNFLFFCVLFFSNQIKQKIFSFPKFLKYIFRQFDFKLPIFSLFPTELFVKELLLVKLSKFRNPKN